jgi:hypothetical protein
MLAVFASGIWFCPEPNLDFFHFSLLKYVPRDPLILR